MAPVDDLLHVGEEEEQPRGPPAAIVARRAKSYSNFYDVVRAQLKKENKLEKEQENKRLKQQISTDVEFGAWYDGIKGDLMDASHEEYQCVPSSADTAWTITHSMTESTEISCSSQNHTWTPC
jgi:hypothetical protein